MLIKNEGNGVYNGVYTWANATAIVRATDADEYGSDSTTQLSINDYFFVQSGNVNAGSAYIVSAPAGTITFGTSNIQFSQFSSSQVYSAGTGLTLTGTTFSVNASQTQITSVGTLGSLTVTANTTSGNLLTGGLISATGNITGGNVLGGANVNATTHTGTTVSVTGNITGGNILGGANVNATLFTGTTVSVTGNITGGNLLTSGLLSATGNITGGNIVTARS